MNSKTYDIFVSYKIINANTVRRVADLLAANGIRVWYAEYYVLLGNYDDFKRYIDDGINSSEYILMFTNNEWADSENCRYEADRIFERFDVEKILEVCIPAELGPKDRYPQLKEVKSIEYTDNVENIINFINEHTELNLRSPKYPRDIVDMNRNIWKNPFFELKMDIGLFSVGPPIAMELFAKDCLIGYFSHKLGTKELSLIITFNTAGSAISGASIDRNQLDDKIINQQYRKHAQKWLRKSGFNDYGLHLYWVRQRSHMALTYDVPPEGKSPGGLERRYVISILDNQNNLKGEINICFFVPSENNVKESRKIFFLLAPYFENLVCSLRFEVIENYNMAVLEHNRWYQSQIKVSGHGTIVDVLEKGAGPWNKLGLLVGAFAGLGVVSFEKSNFIMPVLAYLFLLFFTSMIYTTRAASIRIPSAKIKINIIKKIFPLATIGFFFGLFMSIVLLYLIR